MFLCVCDVATGPRKVFVWNVSVCVWCTGPIKFFLNVSVCVWCTGPIKVFLHVSVRVWCTGPIKAFFLNVSVCVCDVLAL